MSAIILQDSMQFLEVIEMLFYRWKHGILSFQGVAQLSNEEWFTQLPFIFLVSMGGGFLGAAFNWLHNCIFAVSILSMLSLDFTLELYIGDLFKPQKGLITHQHFLISQTEAKMS